MKGALIDRKISIHVLYILLLRIRNKHKIIYCTQAIQNILFSIFQCCNNRTQNNYMNPSSKFSIKQRLKTATHFHHQPPFSASQPPSQRQIHLPQHYNYFIHTVQKQIKRQTNVYQQIKTKIQSYKRQKPAKIHIKNSYEFGHRCFTPSNQIGASRNRNRNELLRTNINRNGLLRTNRNRNGLVRTNINRNGLVRTNRNRNGLVRTSCEPFQSTANISRLKGDYYKSDATFPQSSYSEVEFSYTKTNDLVRSPQSTLDFRLIDAESRTGFSQYAPERELWREPSEIKTKMARKGKQNMLQLVGEKPQWNRFQSYRISSANPARYQK